MRKLLSVITIFAAILIVADFTSCTHDVIFEDDIMMPVDTITSPVDTINNPVDTLFNPCDSTIVYFQYQVLPIFISNCAVSGCHNSTDHQEDIVLDSYQSLIQTTEFTPYNLDETKIYKVLTESGDDRMPPSPNTPLTSEQIQLIATWILQGGEDLTCDWEPAVCDTENISYSQHIVPIISTNCLGCHSGANPGGGFDFSTYDGVKGVADSGKLTGVINWDTGFPAMPEGGDQLGQCTIDQIQAWIEAGALNN